MVSTAYDAKTAATYDAMRFSTASGRRIHEVETRVLQRAIAELPANAKILEVGCGTGRLLVEINDRNHAIIGADASKHMLRECHARWHEAGRKISFVNAEANRIPTLSNTFDLVYAIRVLNQTENAPYALSAIGDMIRTAKPGGLVLVEFMNRRRVGLDGRRVRLNRREAVERVNRRNVRLAPADVVATSVQFGASVEWVRGEFFLGMTILHLLPEIVVGPMSALDHAIAQMLPRLCSRCYVLLRKRQSAE